MCVCVRVCTQVRDEELEELDHLLCSYCELPAAGGVENSYGKINILLQTYISRGELDSFSLISDLSYVAQVRPPSPTRLEDAGHAACPPPDRTPPGSSGPCSRSL